MNLDLNLENAKRYSTRLIERLLLPESKRG